MSEETTMGTGVGTESGGADTVEVPVVEQVETVTETATENTTEEVANPFDFSVEPEQEPAEVEQAEPVDTGDYELDFGTAFGGTDEVRGMITQHAREAGIPAEAGSKFISSVCEQLRVDALKAAQEGYRELEEAWKGDFGTRMNRCKATLHGLLKEGLVTQDDMAALMNPAVFRVVDRLRGALGERSAEGTRQAAAVSAKAQYNEIMSNPKGETFQILMNPSHPKYRETADYMNRLAGMNIY